MRIACTTAGSSISAMTRTGPLHFGHSSGSASYTLRISRAQAAFARLAWDEAGYLGFRASKDRPILFTALASAHTLLTLDREDFADLIGGHFHGLQVNLPFAFLDQERAAGRLRVAPDGNYPDQPPLHGPSR